MILPSTRIPAFCGRAVSPDDLSLIVETVTEFGLPRSEIANTVCELLNWTRANGKLKMVECLKYLESLEQLGCFTLPAPKFRHAAKPRRAKRTLQGEQTVSKSCSLRQLGPVHFALVQTRAERDLWNELIDRHHYLGYRVPFGAQLRYMIQDRTGTPLGCFQWSSAAGKLEARDRWIGWSPAQRRVNRARVVQNSRFLILPGVNVKGLASHVLAQVTARLPDDWEAAYAVRPVLAETFVDADRFRGTCYKAANWQYLGVTKGRGRMDTHHEKREPIRGIWVYPLCRRWRRPLLENPDD